MLKARIVINLAFSLTANAPHIIVKVRFEKYMCHYFEVKLCRFFPNDNQNIVLKQNVAAVLN